MIVGSYWVVTLEQKLSLDLQDIGIGKATSDFNDIER